MQDTNIRRGFTQEANGVTQNSSHSRMMLSGIITLFLKRGGDPRLQASGMTPNLIPPHLPSGHPLQGGNAFETPSSGLRPPSPSRGEGEIGSTRYLPPGARDLKDEALNKDSFRAPLRSGFTLIELLVVVLIIAVLAAVAVPQYQMAVAKSKYATIKPLVESIAAAEEVYYLANGEYTLDVGKLDVSLPHWNHVEDTETDGIVTRKTYTFDWGECYTNSVQVTCSVNVDNVLVFYRQYYGLRSHTKRCIARSIDLNHLANKLCKKETQKQNPDHPSSPTFYLEWWYN